jgi:signal transduction histidine kinase
MGLRTVLEKDQEEILRRFVTEVRNSDLAGAEVVRPVLLDGMPEFLRRVAAGFIGDVPSLKWASPEMAVSTIAAQHALQRWELGYDVQDVVREYGILREIVLDLVAERREPIDVQELKIFSRHISLALSEAVGQLNDARDAAIAHRSAEQFAFLAHDLRSPLTAALVCLQTRAPDEPPSQDALADAEESLRRLARLIDQTLISEKRRSGSALVDPVAREISIPLVVADALRDHAALAASRGVELIADIDPKEMTLSVDPRLLQSALTNLVGNAVKFTHPRTAVVVKARVVAETLCISVEDRCGGLPPGTAARALQPFVQLGADRSGFGLGLAIARQASEAHGGHISIEDLPGRGCRFTLEIPRGK